VISRWKYRINDSDTVTDAAATASTIHNAHAIVLVQSPQAGTQINTNISISVAKPIGQVARKSEFVGSWIITAQISGYSVYRRMDMQRTTAKRIRFKMKKTMDT
jgi:hypothetical protein